MEMPKNKMDALYRFKMVFQLSVVGFVFILYVAFSRLRENFLPCRFWYALFHFTTVLFANPAEVGIRITIVII